MRTNQNNGISIFGPILLILFAAAILVNGKYSPNTSEMITLQIDGIDDKVIAEKVTEIVRMIEGIQTVLIDEKSNLCTFRYDSGKINLQIVESQLAGLGVTFNPIESVKILEPLENRKKLFSIKINPASK
ncbi:hypothetical protein KJ762_05475 [bacterium]|nr:hypothetical protein [bacterium]MBU1065379.1 hypothetical protein [bacterium]MBU1633945.1 hypothetical protein [bacterium]MBU1875211.1 hypothetical protein [bacterium]